MTWTKGHGCLIWLLDFLRSLGTPQGERRIRGTAIYPQAALLNHECLPNVARFDDFDSPHLRAPHNTAVRPPHLLQRLPCTMLDHMHACRHCNLPGTDI
jgi:hypothetical protein